MKIVAIIPARGGSKGIPRKNIKPIAGQPLISYIIKAAKGVLEIDRVIVSTEDKEIAEVAERYGAEVPFLRPAELAMDDIPTLPVIEHAIHYLEEEELYIPDVVVLLYPTSPLMTSESISDAIRLVEDDHYDSVLGVLEDTGHYWKKAGKTYERLYPINPQNRQLTEPLLKSNGGVCVCNRDLLMNNHKLVGGVTAFFIIDKVEAIDVDDMVDFEMAEHFLKKGRK